MFCPTCQSETKLLNSFRLLNICKTRTYECKECGLLFRFPLPSKEKLDNHYLNKPYFRYSDEIEKKISKNQMKWIIQSLPFDKSMLSNYKYVEFGAGRGWLVSEMSKFTTESIGYDADQKSIEWGKDNLQVNLLKDNSLNTDFQKNGKNIIVGLSHILEHIINPEEFLKELKKSYFDPIIFIEVPDGEKEKFILKHDINPLSSSGEHLYSFTSESIKKILMNAGFRYIKLETKGLYLHYLKDYIVKFTEYKIKTFEKQSKILSFSYKKYLLHYTKILFLLILGKIVSQILNLFLSLQFTRDKMPIIRILAR